MFYIKSINTYFVRRTSEGECLMSYVKADAHAFVRRDAATYVMRNILEVPEGSDAMTVEGEG